MPRLPGSTNKKLQQALIAATAICVIVASAAWIYRFEFGFSGQNAQLHQAVGQIMAEETARVVGHQGKVVIITVDNRTAPELKTQIDSFQKQLKALGGISIKDIVVLDPGENLKYRPGAGLSAKRFLKIVRKNPGVDALVSFIGAPQLSDQELAEMKTVPKFIAETHSPEKLANLLEKKLLLSAIVPRYEFPAPGPRKPRTSREWFDRYCQILSPETTVVKGDEAP
jgi:hypothetical protein